MLQNRKNWNDFEDKAILSLVKKYGTKNWAQISEKMSSKYGIETRTGKQCRERWHNHLNPDVNKQAWTEKEEKIMFEAHQKYGNKWTEIAKNFEGRTDNDIKNHFYSMLRRSLRRVNKLLGMRNSTQKIRQIKPSVLSKIFSKNGTTNNKHQTQQDWKKISQYLFQFSKSKSGDDLSTNLQDDQKRKLQDLIQKIAKYNQQYEISQLIKKQSRRSSKKENQDSQEKQLEDIPVIKKISSNHSNKSLKSKKIKKTLKKLSLKNQKSHEKPDKKEKKKDSKAKKQQLLPNEPKEEEKLSLQQQNNQQRQVKQQYFCFHIESEPEQLPQLNGKRKSSYMKQLKGSNSRRSNFDLNSHSPRDPFFSRTPKCPTPTPTISEPYFKNFQFKLNNQELDDSLDRLKKRILRRTNRP